MTGGTINHNRITGNIYISLKLALKEQNYDIFISDVRLWIPKQRIYTYLDIMVIAGQPEYHNNRKDTITNPQVIIEVLSNSTKGYDRSDKFSFYKTLPTFQEYVLIDQTQKAIEQYSKQGNKRWSYAEYEEEDIALVFASFQVEVSLADIYQKVDFAAEEAEDSKEEK